MAVVYTNNATTTLASGITNTATTVTVATATGALFPLPTGADYFYATLVDASNNIEIVKCTARATDVLTIVRGQEGTTARAYSTGDKLELRPTAAGLNSKFDKEGGTVTGAVSISDASTATLNLVKTGTGAGTAQLQLNATDLIIKPPTTAEFNAYGPAFNVRDNSGNIVMRVEPAGLIRALINGGGFVFKDASGGTPYFICQTDNNFVLNGTDASGGARNIFVVGMHSNTAPLIFSVPVQGPTPTAGDNSTKLATTAFVATSFAPLASPAFTGNPTIGGALAGYRNLPTSRTLSSSDTLADSDKGKKIMWTGSTGTITLNPNSSTAIDVDAIGTIVNDGTGNLTITRGAGVSAKLIGTGANADRVVPPGCIATWLKVGTDAFYIGGAGVT